MNVDELKIVSLDKENIAAEHICCGFSDKKSADGYQAKKDWLCTQFPNGFRFKKFDVRGKVFIEYAPAEHAWRPVDAPGFMVIHCFWVSGRYKGKGLGLQLLDECLDDSKDMNGLVVVTSRKTMPFLTDRGFFTKHEFEVCDTAEPYFELLVRYNREAPPPSFRDSARSGACEKTDGVALYYTNMCPFTEYYVDEMLAVAEEHGFAAEKIKLQSRDDVVKGPSPFGIFGAYLNGRFVTHEIMSRSKFTKTLLTAASKET